MFSSRLVQNIIAALSAVVLIIVILLGYRSGTNAGKTRTVLSTVPVIQSGLDYFFRDQNRYPTTTEFSDRNLMLNYFTPFPVQQISGKNCSQSYSYRSSDLNSYTLYFCLPAAKGGFKAGWNQVVNNK